MSISSNTGPYTRLPSRGNEGSSANAASWTRGDRALDAVTHRQGHDLESNAQAPQFDPTHPTSIPLENMRSDKAGAGRSGNATTESLPFSSGRDGNALPEPHQGQTFAAHRRRMAPRIHDAPVESRHTHDYVIRRPRPLMVEHQGHILDLGEEGKLDVNHPERSYHLERKSEALHHREHHPNSLKKQRERMDLFTDLVWVGIISNISEHFFSRVFEEEASFAASVGEFVLLFIPALRIWILLQRFLNCFYVDDLFQRALIVWIMVLGLIWGNNAPYMIDGFSRDDNFMIISFLIAQASLTFAQLIYSIWMPWLRKSLGLAFIVNLPGAVLWIAITFVDGAKMKELLLSLAIIYQSLEYTFFASPVADRILGNDIRQVSDNRTMIRRFENFFIIALGEGVLVLGRGGPLGQGINEKLGRGIETLLIYYFLNWLYFHSDVSKRYIHPVDRRWWIRLLWQAFHIPLFGSLVILSSGTLFLVKYSPGSDVTDDTVVTGGATIGRAVKVGPGRLAAASLWSRDDSSAEPIKYTNARLRVATAITCISLAAVLSCQLGMALLSLSLDKPKTLLVSRPWVRMLPRAASILFFSLIWLVNFSDPSDVLGLIVLALLILTTLEQLMGMPKHARLIEPKEAAFRPAEHGHS